MSFWNNLTTGKDNATHDVARVLAICSCLTGLGLSIYAVVCKGQAFDLLQFGSGIGAMFLGLGSALYLKKDTEPQ